MRASHLVANASSQLSPDYPGNVSATCRRARPRFLANPCLLVLLLLLGAASCKSTSKAEDKGGDTSSAKVTESRDTKAPKGHIRIPSNEPRFLNPILETRFNRANILLFEGLVAFNATLEPVPRLAESWEQSNDGRTITFRLRSGVLWSDGEPFTSKDVAFTVEQIRNTKLRTLWRTYFSGIESIKTPDDLTVVVTYDKPYAPALVSWSVGILPEHKFIDQDFGSAPANSEPVGTGPFKLTRWERGGLMLLSHNDKWWHGSTGLSSIELVFGIDDKLAALKAGKLDFTNISDIAEWASQAQMPDFLDKFEQTTQIESIFRVIAWNTTKAPYNSQKVRQALTHALNRERVIEDLLLGQGQLLSAPFFANMFGADSRIAPRAFNLDKAKALLAEAKVGAPAAGTPLKLITLTSQKSPLNAEMFALFAHDLKSIGFNLEVNYLSPQEFEDAATAGDFDAAFFGWLRDIPDPDPSALLHSAQIQGGQNFAHYENHQVDGWLEEAVATSDKELRKTLYHKIHAQVFEDVPYTVLYAPYSHYAWSRRLRRVAPADVSPQTRFPGISQWSVVE